MKPKQFRAGMAALVAFCLICGITATTGMAESFEQLPAKGMVTMIDLGAKKCIPCKMMAPILAKLENVYAGRAAIVFIDIAKHRDQARRFAIRAIPTQIFFDAEGREVYRHLGFLDENSIIRQLQKMGVAAPAAAAET